jgi:hypothetical protein
MNEGLSLAGWVFITLGWAFILLLNVFCFMKIFSEKKERIVSTMDVEAEIDKQEGIK